uniref:Uncharacterized protein n=1 Tax=Nelumbo nucifera TaxID=4432 RepID=A0A822XT60_NELNU|nr:TPA_asm: hypothetical protein HUJ06_023468 [Nelumbo nucifera]
MMSLKVLSNVSIVVRFAIGASSHMINCAFRKSSSIVLCFDMLHMLDSFALIGILNLEYAVRPPGITVAATPEVVVIRTIQFLDLIVASNAQYTYVFPVPPGPSMKNALEPFMFTRSNIVA